MLPEGGPPCDRKLKACRLKYGNPSGRPTATPPVKVPSPIRNLRRVSLQVLVMASTWLPVQLLE